MKAVCIHRGEPLAPFGDPVATLPVLNTPLAQAQEAALLRAGLQPCDTAPEGEPHLVYSDRTWFSAEAVRKLVAAGPGRIRVSDPGFLEATTPLQDLAQPGVFELALHPGDGTPFDALPPVEVDLELEDADFPDPHPKLRHAIRPVRVGLAQVHQIDHWSHLLRVNHLALSVMGQELKEDFLGAPWWKKLAGATRILGKARSIEPSALAAAITVRGDDAKIHPTAVVEASQVGPGAEIGAHAVVRGAIVGPGARIEEHTTVLGSILGTRAIVARYAMCNFCVVMDEGQVSSGSGWQFSLVGRQAFIAFGSTGLDLSFGGPIKVAHRGERVSSGHHLLGVCIGHGAVIGNGVRLHHGVAVPNEAVVVASADDLLRYPDLPPEAGPFVVEGGRLVPVRRG